MTPPKRLLGREKINHAAILADPTFSGQIFMDAEHINAISNQLADLSLRVNELRGYL
ncbi:MAG: hypothetical protein H7224_11355 [Polaromonas sp.]|nr:hypothetical protein [Polaromonas sp.]